MRGLIQAEPMLHRNSILKGMESIGDLINEQKWLKPVETALDAAAEVTLNQKNPVAQQVRNVLHGTWLGHPLHPLLTDVPLGAWSTATIFDLYELSTGDETFSPGADAAVGIGLIGAGAAAVPGLNDWQFTNDKPKRVGALHAILNIGATLCYLGSWFQRRKWTAPRRHHHRPCGILFVDGRRLFGRTPGLQRKDRREPRSAGIADKVCPGNG